MTTITDKLRRRDFKTKPPQIQPTLKNTIYDYTPTQVKSFELARAKYLDDDYKDGNKAKDFSPANINVLEDTGVKNVSGVSFNEDPFGDFFGFKSENVPDRYLDGYYQYNLKGMTNEKYSKDRLLARGGNITDLETRIQDQAEFSELLRAENILEGKVREDEQLNIAIAFDEEKTRRKQERDATSPSEKEPKKDYNEKLRNKRIEIERAIIGENDEK
jgi:hypothetical protein